MARLVSGAAQRANSQKKGPGGLTFTEAEELFSRAKASHPYWRLAPEGGR